MNNERIKCPHCQKKVNLGNMKVTQVKCGICKKWFDYNEKKDSMYCNGKNGQICKECSPFDKESPK